MIEFAPTWKSSTQRRKQRKYRMNAPFHIKQKFTAIPLSKDLKKKFKKKSMTARKGYQIKIMRGQFKKQTGKIVEVNLKDTKVHVEGIQQVKRDGTKAFYPIHPSNLQIIEMSLEDKKLKKKLETTPKK
jgi:large subunit ribosomal protein L24